MHRRALAAVLATCAALLVGAPAALACSQDATAYFDSFLETDCLETPLTNTELDALGGLRLTTNATSTHSIWTSSDDFTSPENGPSTIGFPRVGTSTLFENGTGALELGAASLPLLRAPANTPDPADDGLVIKPADSTVLDNDNVDDPSVIKDPSGYVMYYSGTAEDGSGPAIFRATSTDSINWTKFDANGATLPDPTPVLSATDNTVSPDAFDEHGVFAPEVVYEPTDASAPYKMWYAGKGDVFTEIGYATSTDGITWVKYDDETADPSADADAVADPISVLRHGKAGAADSFAAQDPAVIKDDAIWKMWYTASDSNKTRIAYATSTDGVTWSKGGAVIGATADEGATNPTNANIREGIFGPTVWKSGLTYNIVFAGRKFLSQPPRYQTRLFSLSSTDGITWSSLNQKLDGTGGNFDSENLNGAEIFVDTDRLRLYYSGNADDTSGNGHQRIGYADSTNDGNTFSKVTATTGPARCQAPSPAGCIVDIGSPGSSFRARQASGLTVAKPVAATYAGFFWGIRGSDFVPRLGYASSTDGVAWTPSDGTLGTGGAVLALTNGNQYDSGGQRDPSVFYLQDTTAGVDDYHLFFTARRTSGELSIGYASADEVNSVTNQLPDNTSWTKASSAVLTKSGAGYMAVGVSHPSVVRDGTGNWVMFFTATDSSGATSIGRAVSSAANGPDGPYAADASPVVPAAGLGTADPGGVRDPVAVFDGATMHLTYAALESVDINGDGRIDSFDQLLSRVVYATCGATGASCALTASPIVLNPSRRPYAYDETGVEPAGAIIDGGLVRYWFDGVDRTGRTRGGSSTTAAPPTAGKIENGWATYQYGDGASAARDFRKLLRAKTGDTVEIWMSFLQPYRLSGSTELWSDYFPVILSDDADNEQVLSFLLTVTAVRWQARLSGPSGSPTLQSVDLEHAPVEFSPTGNAVTKQVAPPAGKTALQWRELDVSNDLYPAGASGSAGGTVTVLDSTGANTLVPATPLSTAATTTVDLAGISAPNNPSLRVRFDLTSASPFTRTLLLRSLKVLYYTDPSQIPPTPPAPPPPPPPPPALDLTLAANPATVVFGQTSTLSGRVTQVGAAVPNQSVSLLQQPFGAPAFAALTSATTSATGDYSSIVTPQQTTTYKATVPTGSSEPTATVQVAQKVTLKASRRGTKGSFSGTIGPSHPAKEVVIQLKKGTGFVSFKKVKTTSTSTFATTAKLKTCAKYQFRAVSAADADHLAGTSAVALVEKHRVTLTVKLKGRRATFTGKVGPLHKSGTVLIKQLVGTKFAQLGKAKLTKRSTFTFTKSLKKGTRKLRADMGADRCHFAGRSAVRTVRVR